MVIGDFNVILSPNGNMGRRRETKMCYVFDNFVDSANLHDLKFKGLAFTWQRGGVFERLDRDIYNDAWILEFPSCSVSHLPRLKLDHQPLLPSLRKKSNYVKGKPFRFLTGWVEHSKFSQFVKDSWNFNGNIGASINLL